MRHGEVSAVIPAPAEDVFDLVHDYSRRLEWDPLLRAAYLDDGFTEAGKGATSVCVGKGKVGGLAFRTVYVSFDRPTVAAVKLVDTVRFFRTWAASIRHEQLADGRSRITYKYNFTAKPRWLAWLFEPILAWAFRRETRKRLVALAAYFARR